MAPNWPILAKLPFLAIRGPGGPKFLTKVDQMVDHGGGHEGGTTLDAKLVRKVHLQSCTQSRGNGPKMTMRPHGHWLAKVDPIVVEDMWMEELP